MLNWKSIFAISFFTFLLSVILYNDTFRTLDQDKINKRKYENCQSLIVGRFLAAENSSFLSYCGLPGQYDFDRSWGICSDRKNFEFYSKQEPTKNYRFEPYLSQIGGNGMIQEAIEQILPFEKSTN